VQRCVALLGGDDARAALGRADQLQAAGSRDA
jgi:hypothetical protein